MDGGRAWTVELVQTKLKTGTDLSTDHCVSERLAPVYTASNAPPEDCDG